MFLSMSQPVSSPPRYLHALYLSLCPTGALYALILHIFLLHLPMLSYPLYFLSLPPLLPCNPSVSSCNILVSLLHPIFLWLLLSLLLLLSSTFLCSYLFPLSVQPTCFRRQHLTLFLLEIRREAVGRRHRAKLDIRISAHVQRAGPSNSSKRTQKHSEQLLAMLSSCFLRLCRKFFIVGNPLGRSHFSQLLRAVPVREHLGRGVCVSVMVL